MPGKDAAVTIAAAIAFSFSTLLMFSGSPATGAQWLTNGSFDDGTAGWQVGGATADGCGPGVVGLLASDDGALLAQNIAGSFTPGAYRFSGRTRTLTQSPVTMALTVVSGDVKSQKTIHDLSTSYSSWSVDFNPENDLTTIRVVISLSSPADTAVCIDDLTFEGPSDTTAATSTPTPSETATAVPPTSTAVPSPTATAISSNGATATATSPATQTTTPVAATPTTTASATATPITPTATSTPSFVFTNGGFEDETAGWKKNGGEIDAVSNPKRSGDAAGRFSSNGASTSWVYQAIVIDPGRAYEFQGALLPNAAVAETYLRISWYASSDGSGALITSDDSATRVEGGGESFAWLTTGPKNPPPGAHSARLRVMLAPLGGGEATVYLDDFSVSSGPLVTATASPTTAPAATQTARAVEATQDARGGSSDTTAAGTPPPGSTAGVAAARATASASRIALVEDTGANAAPSSRRSESGPGTGSNSGRGGESPLVTLQDEPAPLWPYFALPAAGLLGVFGLLHARRKASAPPS